MKKTFALALSLLTAIFGTGAYLLLVSTPAVSASPAAPSAGQLHVIDPGGEVTGTCPLKHTDVKAEISGFLARVTVTQQFDNPFEKPIEAIYTFPLPDKSAVDRMTMRIGDRIVSGKIKPREEARAIYEDARDSGKIASLLDQERPNIFTQSVANILPGQPVSIEISYVETLKYDDGAYQFVFPMVVGPRYIPGEPTGKQGGGWSPDTTNVPDASRITPPVAAPGTRAGHDISLEVTLDAGVPVQGIRSTLHDVDVQQTSDRSAVVSLKNKTEIPNRDFILTYDVAGGKLENALLTHRDGNEGYFTLILQPPDRVAEDDVTPRELVYVIDTSGSMMGYPLDKAKETMELAFKALRPFDTFNLITFSGDTAILFPEPVPATEANLRRARAFLESRQGGGGTEMMKAIRAALDPTDRQKTMRVVCFMTDGYVGNDNEILAEIQRHPNARIFSFGIGNSVNRYLLDRMALEGRGEVEYVTLSDDGSAAAKRFAERVQNPLLTDISIDWGGLDAKDVYPRQVLDVFSAKPIVVTGRFERPGKGTIRLSGRTAGRDVVREMNVEFPARETKHDVLGTLWAREKIEDLSRQDYQGMQNGSPRPEIREGIVQLGLKHGLMTQFTSFVAVEEMVVTEGGQPRRIEVPVEMPDGVSYEGVFGTEDERKPDSVKRKMVNRPSPGGFGGMQPSAPPPPHSGGSVKPARKESASDAFAVGPRDGKDRDKSGESPKPAEQRQNMAKMDTALQHLAAHARNRQIQLSVSEQQLIQDGKVEVRIWLTEKTAAVLAELKRLGFEVIADPKSSKSIIGRIPVEKIEELSNLATVKYAKANR